MLTSPRVRAVPLRWCGSRCKSADLTLLSRQTSTGNNSIFGAGNVALLDSQNAFSFDMNGSGGKSKVEVGMILAADSLFGVSGAVHKDRGLQSYLSLVHNGIEA